MMSSCGSTARADKCPYELWDEETLFEGRWLCTKQIKFRTAKGGEGVWQSAHRPFKRPDQDCHGVMCIAVLKKDGKKYYILIKQYRIPVRAFCLEFPAGLVDEGETAEQSAVRELKEETGYTATRVLHKSEGGQAMDPAVSDNKGQYVAVEVDGDADVNKTPDQRLESDEDIEVILVECEKLLEYVQQVPKDVHVNADVYTYALGAHMARTMSI